MSRVLANLYLTLEDLIEPLRERFSSLESVEYLFYSYGWQVKLDGGAFDKLNQVLAFKQPLDEFMAAAGDIRQKMADDSTSDPSADDLANLIASAGKLINAVVRLKSGQLTDLVAPLNDEAFWTSVGEHLLDDLLEEYLRIYQPTVYLGLHAGGVIQYLPTAPTEASRVAYARTTFDWDQLSALLHDPLAALKSTYHWGGDSAMPFAYQRLLEVIAAVLKTIHVRTRPVAPGLRSFIPHLVEGSNYAVVPNTDALGIELFNRYSTKDSVVYELGLELFPALKASDTVASGLILTPVARGGVSGEVGLGDMTLRWQTSADASELLGVGLFPDEIKLLHGDLSVGASIEVTGKTSEPAYLLGSADGARVELYGPTMRLSIEGTPTDPEARLHIGAKATDGSGCKVVVPLGEADSFVSKTSSRNSLDFSFSPDLIWSSKTGLAFSGSPRIDLNLPLSLSLGPVTITGATISLGAAPSPPAGKGGWLCRVGVSFTGKLGPVTFVVDNVGAQWTIIKRSRNELLARGAQSGVMSLGPLDIDTSFAPPHGVGIAIDASAVVGGGYLNFDPDKGEYGGVLQLEIAGRISVTAIGLLSTRLPDGSHGYSLILLITAEGFQPIQLGMGFTLNGIGGLLAINRTFNETAMREGLKNDTLSTVLFPKDPIANAPQIFRSLTTLFPAQTGSYLFGPLVKIGWGTPTLIDLSLALILEIGARNRLIALGRVSSILPNKDDDLLRLNMDAVGILDFDQGTVSLDAVLVDSRLGKKFVLSGSMALRACLVPGPQAGFVLAVGGMNPHFTPPVVMPKLDRIAISLASGDNPRITCDAYFALTANTVQFGSRSSLYASASGFSVEGDVSFDVLIQLLPLHFLAEFHASIQLKCGSRNLFKVSVDGALEGPRPLRVSAKATFEILWCDFSVSFDKTLVDGDKPALPSPVDALGALLDALGAPANWSARLPPHQHGVSMRRLAADAPLALDPLGQLSVTQSVVPINTSRDLDLWGGAPLGATRRFNVSGALTGLPAGLAPPVLAASSQFAPSQFFDLTDEEKLASPSFEDMQSGLVMTSSAVTLEASVALRANAPLAYDTFIIDAASSVFAPIYSPDEDRLLRQARFAAVARSALRKTGVERFRSPDSSSGVTVRQPGWRIAAADDLLDLAPGLAEPVSWGDARASLQTLKAQAGATPWQLVPEYEAVP